MVVSTWGTLEHWEAWANDEFRRKMDERINLMLRKPSTLKVFCGVRYPAESWRQVPKDGGAKATALKLYCQKNSVESDEGGDCPASLIS